jgi:hypothetical protein
MQTESDLQRIRDREDNRHLDAKYDARTRKEERDAEDKLESDVMFYITEHQNGPALELLQSMQVKFGIDHDQVGKFIAMWIAEL